MKIVFLELVPMQGSKSLEKRKAEEEVQRLQEKEAKKMRQEMRQRGHAVSPPRDTVV
jgi:hypothetical protein